MLFVLLVYGAKAKRFITKVVKKKQFEILVSQIPFFLGEGSITVFVFVCQVGHPGSRPALSICARQLKNY